MEQFTVEDVYKALLVILAICAAIITVGKAFDVIKGWRKPSLDTTKAVEDKLAADKRVLDRHEDELRDLKQGQSLMLQSLNALLEHAIHDGNVDEMIEAQKAITKYLIGR